MTQIPELPNQKKVKQTLANCHRSCQEMELAGLQLEEALVKIEQENRQKRIQQLGKILHS